MWSCDTALSVLSFSENGADVVPHQPMLVDFLCPVSRVKGPSYCVIRLDIYAYPKCLIRNKPMRHQAEQLRSDPDSSRFRDDVDPFQFSVAGIALREVTCREGDNRAFVYRHVTRSRSACVSWIQFTCQVSGNALLPIL